MDVYYKKIEKVVLPNTYIMENPLAKKQIRLARTDDYPAILFVYTPFITDTTVTFEYDVPPISEFAARLETIAQTYPILVLEVDERIIGYAYAASFKPRAAYQWVAETVIYLRPDCGGHGLGQLLYLALIEVLKLQGICQGIGVITAENMVSVGFHRKMGYHESARLEKVGFKFGRWLDVLWMQNQFAQLPERPQRIRSIGDIVDTDDFKTLLLQINSRLNNY
ncbi:GNAT family N-acetyltransferase [Parabacteroides sp. FAFU027]|uniref:GNAT family N-acetyltransferase n=1 Tax=Parabacteroides sp. FAFU027 TaxID=2922715 RepID=UPI001FAECBE0|nr:GNAT family N-acetyltransferase [Parabacteroides sp. FAFU027]